MTQDNSKAKVRKAFYSSGALMKETPYVDGKEHGISKQYYESGALWCEIPYVNGKTHGIEKWYCGSGALHSETPYVNGQRHGIQKEYNRDTINIDYLILFNKDRILLTLSLEKVRKTSSVISNI